MSEETVTTGYIPRPLQAKLHKELKRFSVMVCHRRFGKCHTALTPVLTSNGFKPISEITEGEHVFTPSGKPTKVLKTYERGLKEIYEVVFSNGESIECDDEHQWYAEPAFSAVGERAKRNPWACGKLLTTKELMDSDHKFIPVAEPLVFEGHQVPIDPWLMGYWLGHGNKDEFKITTHVSDAKAVEAHGPSSYCSPLTDCVAYYFSGMRPFLRELSLLNNKHIPNLYKFNDFESRVELLRGLMDSGGMVSNSGQCVFDNKNELLLGDVRWLIESLGLKCSKSFYDRPGRGREFRLFFTAKGFNPFGLERKAKLVRMNDRPIRHKIVSIIKTNRVEPVYCFMVEDDSHLFLVSNSMIPTHNTVFTINHTLDKALRNPLKNPQYAYIAPNYGQAKRVAWDMLKEFVKDLPGVTTNEQELRMDIQRPQYGDRMRIMLLGAENPASLRGLYLDGAVLDEYAECDPTIWGQVVRPALADRLGWAIFIGTPHGQNHFYNIYQTALKNLDHNWYAALYKASETNVIDPGELAAAKREMTAEEFDQEFECDFSAALLGAYYGKLMTAAEEGGRITKVPHEPSLPVDTYWDLGVDDSTAIWFMQQVGSETRLIDYYENSGEGLPHYAQMLTEGDRRNYTYREHVLPHDGAVRDLSTGKKRQDTLRELVPGGRVIVGRKHKPENGINSSRLLIPKCWFDRVKCERGLMALRNYQKKFDSKNQIWASKPLHDWSSHGADAFRLLAVESKAEANRRDPYDRQQDRAADYGYNIFGG